MAFGEVAAYHYPVVENTIQVKGAVAQQWLAPDAAARRGKSAIIRKGRRSVSGRAEDEPRGG